MLVSLCCSESSVHFLLQHMCVYLEITPTYFDGISKDRFTETSQFKVHLGNTFIEFY